MRTQPNTQLSPGHQVRLLEFGSFETEFEKCISKSAIKTKLEQPTQRGKSKIRNVMDEVEKKVSITLNDEIKRLYNIIDEYGRPFHPDEHQLNWYKKELHTFVEEKLGSNVGTRLNMALTQSLELTQKEIRGNYWHADIYCK